MPLPCIGSKLAVVGSLELLIILRFHTPPLMGRHPSPNSTALIVRALFRFGGSSWSLAYVRDYRSVAPLEKLLPEKLINLLSNSHVPETRMGEQRGLNFLRDKVPPFCGSK